MHPFIGVQKKMLKAWNFTRYKICHRCFDDNFQKNFRTNFLQSYTADTSDSCFKSRIMLKQLTDINFKMISSLLAAREISPLEF